MALKLRCPHCRKAFAWKSATDMPDDCPLCGEPVGHDRDDDDIVMPFVSSAKARSMDQVYRQIEAGSERRVELAAEMTGQPKEDFAGLKITNLNDRRDTPVMAMPVRNAVTEHMAKTGQGGFTGGEAVGYSGSVQTGPFPNAGAKMRTTLQQQHAALSHGAAVSDRPALETQQPGYRRRG